VNIHWVTIANHGGFGVMKFLVDKLDAAVRALKRQGLMVSLLPVLAVEVPDRPGALQMIAEVLGRSDLNLDNCSGFVVNDRAILLIEPSELEPARAVLEAQNWRLLTEQELHRLGG
jgi:hypothetical protein